MWVSMVDFVLISWKILEILQVLYNSQSLQMDVSENSGTPKSSILIGFSIIFTIHFGVRTPILGNTHLDYHQNGWFITEHPI